MSWNIYVYAEVRNLDKSSNWEPLTDKCLCDNFKHYDADFASELPRMKASESVHPSILKIAADYNGDNFYVSYCLLSELRKHCCSIIDKFNTHIKAVYAALGIGDLCIDQYDDEYYCDDCTDENDECANSINPWFKHMTFPVNKKLISNTASYLGKYSRALQILGLCDIISSMCDNYNDEVRLIFATL